MVMGIGATERRGHCIVTLSCRLGQKKTVVTATDGDGNWSKRGAWSLYRDTTMLIKKKKSGNGVRW